MNEKTRQRPSTTTHKKRADARAPLNLPAVHVEEATERREAVERAGAGGAAQGRWELRPGAEGEVEDPEVAQRS